MKNKLVLIVVLINLTLLVALVFVYPQFMISPGKPIDAHAEIATDCFACHSPFFGSSPEKCVSCHKVADIGIRTTKGVSIAKEKKNVAFHQRLIEKDCVACHSDHKGVKAFRPISQFSHGLLESAIQEQCDGCHGNPGDALHQKIKGNCGKCHTQEAWLPATFDHDRYFRFDRHHDTECATCHVDNVYDSYTCYGCHEHSRSKIREEHVEEGIRDYENCVDCHRSGDEEEAKRRWRSRRLERGADSAGTFRRDSDDHESRGRDDD
jgi:hypothetical protein